MVTLVLNSPRVELKLLRRLAGNSVLIGVDGGLNIIAEAGLSPRWAVGDFDSVSPELLKKLAPSTKLLRFPREKNFTDMELALHLARIFRPRQINVLGIDGGDRFDHQLVNCLLLGNLARAGCIITAWGSTQKMIFTSMSVILPRSLGRFFSVMALSGPAAVSILGGKYPAHGLALLPGMGIGLGNELKGKMGVVKVEKGSVCISQWQNEV